MSGSVKDVQYLFNTRPTSEYNQIMLTAAAQTSNLAVFRFLLLECQSCDVDDNVRLEATSSSVDIWKSILEYNPKLINWDFGHWGDLLTKVAMSNNIPLLAFLLSKGLDPNHARWLNTTLYEAYSRRPTILEQEAVDLLVKYGATLARSRAASGLCRLDDTAVIRATCLRWLPACTWPLLHGETFGRFTRFYKKAFGLVDINRLPILWIFGIACILYGTIGDKSIRKAFFVKEKDVTREVV